METIEDILRNKSQKPLISYLEGFVKSYYLTVELRLVLNCFIANWKYLLLHFSNKVFIKKSYN